MQVCTQKDAHKTRIINKTQVAIQKKSLTLTYPHTKIHRQKSNGPLVMKCTNYAIQKYTGKSQMAHLS
jgi:hypothetical protein